jgi:hypothetical protein
MRPSATVCIYTVVVWLAMWYLDARVYAARSRWGSKSTGDFGSAASSHISRRLGYGRCTSDFAGKTKSKEMLFADRTELCSFKIGDSERVDNLSAATAGQDRRGNGNCSPQDNETSYGRMAAGPGSSFAGCEEEVVRWRRGVGVGAKNFSRGSGLAGGSWSAHAPLVL